MFDIPSPAVRDELESALGATGAGAVVHALDEVRADLGARCVSREELRADQAERDLRLLSTLASKDDVAAAVGPLATKAEIAVAVAPLATKAELAVAVAPLATKAELAVAVAPLATKAELAPLATKAELAAAIAPLATKAELAAAVAPLATKAELAALATKAELAQSEARLFEAIHRLELSVARLAGRTQMMFAALLVVVVLTNRDSLEFLGHLLNLMH